MKNWTKELAVGAVAVACAFTMAACASEGDSASGKPDEGEKQTFAQRQIALAQDTYDAFYQKDGLFSAQAEKTVAALSFAADEGGDTVGESRAAFDEVRNALVKYKMNVGDTKNMFNSYVADIFSYSQVQTSIINKFGEESLTDVYALTYDDVDWSSDTTAYGNWIESTKLLSASFAGADLESGNVYCTQAHRSNGVLVLANLEYYHHSDSDMGVTTLNWHSNGRFEYHYCSAGTYENMQAFGNCSENGDITLNSFSFYQQNSRVASTSCSAEEKELVYDYIQSEIARIDGKIENLKEENGRERSLDGTEETDKEQEEHVGVCPVSFDFTVLSRMLLK